MRKCKVQEELDEEDEKKEQGFGDNIE